VHQPRPSQFRNINKNISPDGLIRVLAPMQTQQEHRIFQYQPSKEPKPQQNREPAESAVAGYAD
jgi:hypothetical protein